jgi:reversibly glycosylated polypeptide/UDP-arabinopyranose mutase
MGGRPLNVALVVPTIRPDSFRAFLDAWTPSCWWDRLYVVEDRPYCTPGLAPADAVHVSHEEVDADLGDDSWIISRRDSAVRSYGFLRAWRDGAEVIVTLDDDCFPVDGADYLAGHLAAFHATPRWITSVPGLIPRGLPYKNRGTVPRVMLNMGLWRGVPDLDAARSLIEGVPTDYVPPDGNWLVPAGQAAPLCGMNVAFRREAAPLMYFGLNGPPWPFGRFDDLTCGVIAKRVFDHLGWRWSIGEPHVEHRRASDPFANLAKEGAGVGWYEAFWEAAEGATLAADDPAGCMLQLGAHLAGDDDPYTAKLGQAVRLWAGLFAA